MTTIKRNCDTCGKPITVPPDAPHKRFCSVQHRDEWHARHRKAAFAALKAQGEAEAKQPARPSVKRKVQVES